MKILYINLTCIELYEDINLDIKSEGKKLLIKHSKLYKKLEFIPNEREIEFREEFIDGKWFGKPRFIRPKYQWDELLFTELRNYLQEIWIFFEKYNYWLDETILPLIEANSRRTSSKSIIFLLENDVWNTSEVYGRYLIEKGTKKTVISYYRFDTTINKNTLDINDENQIKKWVCNDAKEQIKLQFFSLWSRLENEIKVCIAEEYSKKPRIYLTDENLKKQYEMVKNDLKSLPEASLLCLGRFCELWLLILLNQKHKKYQENLIDQAHKEHKINMNQVRLLYKIKRNYNHLKHKLYYQIDIGLINELVSQFSELFFK